MRIFKLYECQRKDNAVSNCPTQKENVREDGLFGGRKKEKRSEERTTTAGERKRGERHKKRETRVLQSQNIIHHRTEKHNIIPPSFKKQSITEDQGKKEP